MKAAPNNALVQVLESNDGRIFRITLSTPVAPGNVILKTHAGTTNVQLTPIGPWLPEPNLTVFSFTAPADTNAFELYAGNTLIAKATNKEVASLVHKRDLAMINPAIDPVYGEWLERNPVKVDSLADAPLPLMSIVVPLYNTPPAYLQELLQSVFAQTYANWELVLVNASPHNQEMQQILAAHSDTRISLVELQENLGIAGNTNQGIRVAHGDYILFADHDDTLHPELLRAYVRAIQDNSTTDLLYCDEDNFETTDSGYFQPRFKPEANPELICSFNYVVHCLCVSRWLLERVELSPDELSGAQDSDLTLKGFEKARQICHIPQVLYHWRQHEGSTNGGVMQTKPYAIEAGRKAIAQHYKRAGINAHVEATEIPCTYETCFDANQSASLSVIIAAQSLHDANACIKSLQEVWLPPHTTVVVVPYNTLPNYPAFWQPSFSSLTSWRETLQRQVETPPACVNLMDAYAAGAGASKAELMLFIDARVRQLSTNAIQNLMGYACQKQIGAVAPRLLYADGLIYSAGISKTLDNTFVYLNQNFTPDGGGGYNGYAAFTCDFTALAPECFMLRREVWQTLELTLEHQKELASSIPLATLASLCDSLHEQGLRTVSAPIATATLERATVRPIGYHSPEELNAFKTLMQNNPHLATTPDVLFNPHVDIHEGYPHLNVGGL